MGEREESERRSETCGACTWQKRMPLIISFVDTVYPLLTPFRLLVLENRPPLLGLPRFLLLPSRIGPGVLCLKTKGKYSHPLFFHLTCCRCSYEVKTRETIGNSHMLHPMPNWRIPPLLGKIAPRVLSSVQVKAIGLFHLSLTVWWLTQMGVDRIGKRGGRARE